MCDGLNASAPSPSSACATHSTNRYAGQPPLDAAHGIAELFNRHLAEAQHGELRTALRTLLAAAPARPRR